MISAVTHHCRVQQTLVSHPAVDSSSAGGTAGDGGAMALVLKRARAATGPLVRMLPCAFQLYHRVETVFFMNSTLHEQTLVSMTMQYLGKVVYHRYNVDRSGNIPVWKDHSDLTDYIDALTEEARFDQLREQRLRSDPQAVAAAVLKAGPSSLAIAVASSDASVEREPRGVAARTASVTDTGSVDNTSFDRFHRPWVEARTAYIAVEGLERSKQYRNAAALLEALLSSYPTHPRRGRWWDRLALHLETRLGDPGGALDACALGIRDPAVRTGRRLALIHRAERICRSGKHAAALGTAFTRDSVALALHPEV